VATRAPSPAILGAVLLHAGVAAMFFVRWPESEAIVPMVNSVPVSIVSSEVIEAAPADNPSEELVTEEAATAPVESPPEPTPPEPMPPAPAPTPPPPRPAPTTRPTPPRETRPAPTPTRPTPPRPETRPTPPRAETRPAPSRSDAPPLDLDALAGPRRPAPTPGPRAPTGQQGRGQAPQATGPQIAAIFNQVYPNWVLPCDIPGANQLRIEMDVTLSADGRIASGPTLRNPRSDSVYRAAADGALRAIRQTAPFDVPQGFPGGAFRPTFNTERACRNR
jgi:outer membrane biosynthesis protein TonB